MPRRRSAVGGAASRWSPRLAAVAVLSLLALVPVPAGALNFEEWVQGLTVTPFLSQRVEYQSNVFQTPSHAQGDTIFKTIPGFLAELSRSSFAASVGYRAEILNYVTLTNQNTTNQFGVVQLKLDYSRLKLQLKNDFTETTDPPNSELTGPIKSQTNVLAPTAEYRLTERFSLGVNYAWTHINYPGNAPAGTPNEQQNQAVQELNEDRHVGGATLWWKFAPKADAGLTAQYGAQTFDNDPARDTRIQIVALALRGDLTSKLSSTFRIGAEHQEATNAAPSFTGLILGGGWIYRITERTELTATVDRAPQPSIFENAQYYISTTGWLGFRHDFPGRKLSFWLRTGAGEDTYNTKQPTGNGTSTKYRVDTLVGASSGLDYAIRPWLRTGIEYSFRQRTSNFPQYNYDDNKVSGRMTVQF
ncbi:MAG TPA: outer membrane beta-barrel protein [Candidatus Bathyarchaeia archaeon]|nr:outer membrane beta-barrel protein [Candidatus Bathyarchaeia archaeon]